MPRKLPWLQSTAAPKAHVSSTPKPDTRTETKTYRSDSGVSPISPLPVSVKRKRRANTAESPSLIQKRNGTDRAPSSSPIPAPEEPQQPIEPMRKALNKYDLRDDEWMMVEDELLQTAKSFTRHLHLAEYELLKKNLGTRKDVARPVIANAKPSEERKLRMRIEAQKKAQRKALDDVAEETSEDSADDLDAPVRASSSQHHISTSRMKAATMPPPKKPVPAIPATTHPSTTPKPTLKSIFTQKLQARKAAESNTNTNTNKPTSKPPSPPPPLPKSHPHPHHHPPPRKHAPRASKSIFDLLDEIDTPSTSSTKPIDLPKSRGRHSLLTSDIATDFHTSKHSTTKPSKRKTEVKKKDDAGGVVKKKSVNVDEIPTFLF